MNNILLVEYINIIMYNVLSTGSKYKRCYVIV